MIRSVVRFRLLSFLFTLIAATGDEDQDPRPQQHTSVRSVNDQQSRRELTLGLRFRDFCLKEGEQYRTVRKRPLFRRFAGTNANMVPGKCNACPCDGGPNEECDVFSNLCVCQKGFQKDANDVCTDINECVAVQSPCKAGKTCTNVPGNYTCNACPCGAPNEVCDESAQKCLCKKGFEFNTTGDCVDIDECSRAALNATRLCGSSSVCSNTLGSYQCNSCPCQGCTSIDFLSTCTCGPGFVRPNVTSPSKAPVSPPPSNCTDINECAVNPNICGTGNTCTNLPGNYSCTSTPSTSPGGGGGGGGGGIGGGPCPLICYLILLCFFDPACQ